MRVNVGKAAVVVVGVGRYVNAGLMKVLGIGALLQGVVEASSSTQAALTGSARAMLAQTSSAVRTRRCMVK